ncbi:Protein MON2 like protein [Verticillium longisporum]|uniref:Protein MON2 like protein n=1 Tax=Verticillium longisporum TaxID=100787 RepID=A0A8I2Z5Y3_VERLO|nr:Protein MON2 like protein [Verticillium longisporum]
MTTQLLATELANLISESKRKHTDLRQAAEKALEELKAVTSKASNEAQAISELTQRPNFVNPFVIACGTKNTKFTAIAITSKNAIVNNTSAATLQQLVVSVFDKVVTEDRTAPADGPPAGEAPTADADIPLREAALDAYRIFKDLCLMTENQRPEYLRLSALPQTFGLELIESVLTNHAAIFVSHPEQAFILQSRVMPFIISALKDRPNFATSVRLDTALWKRALCMEVFRGIFSEHALLRRIFMLYDAKEGEKNILQTLTATFVRISTEKPAVIGLGHQSTLPVANPYANSGATADQVVLETGGVTGIMSGSVGSEGSNTGISSQWSNMRVPCIDQLDKTEPPSIPESYIYSLTLSCISSFSEGLAKFILPLTDQMRKTLLMHLALEVILSEQDECWPAILATCSTFLYAALDSEYYHSLVRAFQKFAHVAGLLQLSTPRDAFLTTLGKAAVPPNVFTACLNAGSNARTPSFDASRDSNSLVANFGAETKAVETAASRLIESTVDFPNDAFIQVVDAICDLLDTNAEDKTEEGSRPQSPPGGATLKPTSQHRKAPSPSAGASAPNQQDQFALAKLGDIATINIERLLSYPPDVSGWGSLVCQLAETLNSTTANASVRLRAAEILVNLALESANVALTLEPEERGPVQLQVLESLRNALRPLEKEDRDTSVANHATDVEIHKVILEGLKSLLENCGEALVSGKPSDAPTATLLTRSPKLVRSSFSSLQLICSDFLTSLPNDCFLILVDTLYKFSSQYDDLNIALTTVTFFWVLSDHLSGKNKPMSITTSLMDGAEVSDLAALAGNPKQKSSNAALWMLLLLRLTAVTADDRLELRNSAIQTLLRIFDAYGDNLNPEAWFTCVKFVIFRLLSSIEDELRSPKASEGDEDDRKEWHGTSVLVLNGISQLLASYLNVLSKHPSFNNLWQELLAHFTTLLDFKILDVSTATFKALGQILAQGQPHHKSSFSKETVDAAWQLWSRGIPVAAGDDGTKNDNQNCLTAYVGAFHDVYRLVSADLTVERVRQMLTLFREALQRATVGAYVNDVEYTTPLQNQVLEAIKTIRTDLEGVPSAMISQVAEFVRLPFNRDPAREGASKRTYVAMSKGSMAVLQRLVLIHAGDADVADTEAAPDKTDILDDEAFDMKSFRKLRELIIPSLGAEVIPDKTRKAYAESLFRTSMIHTPPPGDSALGADGAGLSAMYKPRKGRTSDPAAKARSKMSYVCLEELFSLVATHDEDTPGPSITIQPPTPRWPPPALTLPHPAPEPISSLHIRTARATAPFLILRAALPLRAFIADQPLRGRMPQPLSQRRELLRLLEALVALQSQPEAIPDSPNVECETRKHLLRLYPLLVAVVRVAGAAGDEAVLHLGTEALDIVGGELGG